MVDEGGRAQPQLGAPLSGGVHDAEVVLPGPEQVLVLLTQLRDAAYQQLQLLVLLPAKKSLHCRALSEASQSSLGMRASPAESPREQGLHEAGPAIAISSLTSPTSSGSYPIHGDRPSLCSQQPPYQARVDTILAPLVSME